VDVSKVIVTRREVLARSLVVGVGVAWNSPSVTGRAFAGSGAEPEPVEYAVTLAKSRLRLPPFATAELPKELRFRLRLDAQPGQGTDTLLYLSNAPATATPDDVLVQAVLTWGADGETRSFNLVFGPGRGASKMQYRARYAVKRAGGSYGVSLPAVEIASAKVGGVFHPLVGQMFLGRLYDFEKGGIQQFALLLDWDGDALQPVATLATLKLEAAGVENVKFEGGTVKARKVTFAVSGTSSLPEAKRKGFFLVGPGGEVLQTSAPSPFGIPFDNGKALAPSVPDPERGGTVLRTTGGETIRATRKGNGYEVALYGKSPAPFVVATLDRRLALTEVRETWNGRTRVSRVLPSEVRYSFTESVLETVAAEPGVLFFPQLLATDTWEGEGRFLAGLNVGESKEAVYVPLLLNTAGWSNRVKVERLADAPPALGERAKLPETVSRVAHYRMTASGEDAFAYDLYTDGARLGVLRGGGLKIVRAGWEAFATLTEPPPPAPPKPAP
jgi:hypothetical protein